MLHQSALAQARSAYRPKLPASLNEKSTAQPQASPDAVDEAIRAQFPQTYGQPAVTFAAGNAPVPTKPHRAGVILSGGPAPGGHNVIAGLFDALKKLNPASTVFGFRNGPDGLLKNDGIEIDSALLDAYRNTGGFDIIGSGRTKLESEADFLRALETAAARQLTALVVIGGDDSNSNASKLAEFAKSRGSALTVVGVPKTIDGDLKGAGIETSFGFDTACKVYSDLIGNIQRDALSARKYWHFIKLMGRSASHIALECALQTRPNITLVSEEVAAKKSTLGGIVAGIADTIAARAANGEKFGTVLIPEGLIEFVPEMGSLISELNETLAHHADAFNAIPALPEKRAFVAAKLQPAAAALYKSLPDDIANQLILDRDPHGNVQVARIDTQRLLIDLVEARLKEMKAAGAYKASFAPLPHYFGYEGRCAAPSNFDADYCYTLGFTAALLIRDGLTGTIASVRGLTRPASEWQAGGVPLARMMNIERRHGKMVPVIKKALVELDGAPFREFEKHRAAWAIETSYAFPGPIQYFGPAEVCDTTTATLRLETAAS
ncbi:MAG: diphosphate--fructose-6-phosphate 1-phosphotransferase [Verrucomicrobia bacterium]|nr:diphosphate--fructose-6-phosphate 1-phosphotransferase [Verrucomicrobiota bacterium]